MYQIINQHCNLVIDAALDPEGYLQLCTDLRSSTVSVVNDPDFQRRYRNYWQMNAARLGAPFYGRYFQVLSDRLRSGNCDVAAIVDDLTEVSNGKVQFSFATKLANMIDQRMPIYDSFVADFYFYDAPTDKSIADRIRKYLAFHEFLRFEYERVIRQRLLDPAIAAVRARYSTCATVCDERIIDWLIWGAVTLLRRQVQQGRCVYQ